MTVTLCGTIYSKTRKDAASKLAAAIAERDSGVIYHSGVMTVRVYVPDSIP